MASTSSKLFYHSWLMARKLLDAFCEVSSRLIRSPFARPVCPIHFDKTPGQIQRAAPTLGPHTEEILREVGYGDKQIEELRQNGVIPQPAS